MKDTTNITIMMVILVVLFIVLVHLMLFILSQLRPLTYDIFEVLDLFF